MGIHIVHFAENTSKVLVGTVSIDDSNGNDININ